MNACVEETALEQIDGHDHWEVRSCSAETKIEISS